MAKSANLKLKLLYLARLFLTQTDEHHGLTTQDIILSLERQGMRADRKTIYQDLEELRQFGLDIVSVHQGRQTYYHLASRTFELAELKLLVDSVQASRFITERKSRQLIEKLSGLVSVHEAAQLTRQVILPGRVKTINEHIYYTVDNIHAAIHQDCQVSFQYTQWNSRKELEPRHGGRLYQISPWALVWDDEYYYLIGYDNDNEQIRHYRTDKIRQLTLVPEKRLGRQQFAQMTLPDYENSLFGMYGGDLMQVTLNFQETILGIIIDRFGQDIPILPISKNWFQTHVQVTASPQFLGWVFALGHQIRIVSPDSLSAALQTQAKALLEQYT